MNDTSLSKTLFKLVACAAWAGLAISSATPANALALTKATGDYATCSANVSTTTAQDTLCPMAMWSYTQNIRFSSTSCHGGTCGSSFGTTHVEYQYDFGRKPAHFQSDCYGYTGGTFVYALDSCAC